MLAEVEVLAEDEIVADSELGFELALHVFKIATDGVEATDMPDDVGMLHG